jgi:site-specific recombinase XerD
MMLEELERRNYSEATTRCYIRTVEDFSRRFKRSPDCLGPEHIREYQAELFKKRKLSPGTVTQRLAALRFFYIKTLKKAWSIADTPYPKRAFHLPSILSREEVARLIDAALNPYHRTLLMTLYATGVRRAELTHLKVSDIDSKRMVIHVQGGKGRKDRDVMLSRNCSRYCVSTGADYSTSPAHGCFQAIAGIPVIGRSPPRWSGTLARKPPSERASRKMCTPIR